MTNEEFMDALVRLLKFQGFHDAATLFEAVRFFSFHLLESIYILLQITVTPRNQMICLLNNFVYCSMFLICFLQEIEPQSSSAPDSIDGLPLSRGCSQN